MVISSFLPRFIYEKCIRNNAYSSSTTNEDKVCHLESLRSVKFFSLLWPPWMSSNIIGCTWTLFVCLLLSVCPRLLPSTSKVPNNSSEAWTASIKISALFGFFTSNVAVILSWVSAVGIAIGYGLDVRGVGVQVLVRSNIFSFFTSSYWLWGPPSLICNGYRGLFRWGKAAGAWNWPLTSN
jgi:hypothetical protein